MKFLYFWKPFLWLAIICFGLFIPASELPTKPFLSIPYFDKIIHFGLFFGLCLLFFKPFKKLETRYYMLAPITSIAIGASLEWMQRIVTVSRSSDIFDFLANASGIVVALIFYRLFVSGKKLEILF